MMLQSPQTALYWGSYLMKVCADTKSLCMQFESVVTNSSLTFADIQFLEINQEIAAILKLSEIGDVDWQQLLDDIASVPDNFTTEKQAIAIVFHFNQREDMEGKGYAVYLWNIAPEAFADSIGVEQGTSADLTAYDGNSNTFALYDTRDVKSPFRPRNAG